MALLQRLTPAQREQLARSDTPLADVRTPEKARRWTRSGRCS
jgi:hypothetical protein